MNATIKMTNLEMDWDDGGARVYFQSSFLLDIHCPRCDETVHPGVEHLCGDRVPKPEKKVKGKK